MQWSTPYRFASIIRRQFAGIAGLEPGVHAEAGVVEQEIDAAVPSLHVREHRRDGGRVRHVAGDGGRGAAELRGQSLEPIAPPCREDTCAPSATSSRAAAAPMPLDAPVMTATLPVRVLHLHV